MIRVGGGVGGGPDGDRSQPLPFYFIHLTQASLLPSPAAVSHCSGYVRSNGVGQVEGGSLAGA